MKEEIDPGVTDEMVEESFRRLEELEHNRIRREGHEEGYADGIRAVITHLEKTIEFMVALDQEWKAKGLSLRYTSHAKKINVLKQHMEDLKEAFRHYLTEDKQQW